MNRKEASEKIERRINELLNKYDVSMASGNLSLGSELLGEIEMLLEQLEENTYYIKTQTFMQ